MNASTTREPFTLPLTSSERNYIRQRRSEIVRERTKPRSGRHQLPVTHELMVAEIDSAIAFWERGRLGGSFPTVCRVPKAALSAVVTP